MYLQQNGRSGAARENETDAELLELNHVEKLRIHVRLKIDR
jgi:hypothetical protein